MSIEQGMDGLVLTKNQIKQAEKEARRLKMAEAQKRQVVAVADYSSETFGDYRLVQSSEKSGRTWLPVATVGAALNGRQVWVRARLETVRAKGKMCFLVLRQTPYTLQGIISESDETPRPMLKYISKIPAESIVDVFGTVAVVDAKIDSVTQGDVEIKVEKCFVVNASEPVLPMQIADANRALPKDLGIEDQLADDESAQPIVERKTRLDNRWIDLRAAANHAIFRIQSAVCTYYREFLLARDFIEVHTPKLISAASEGGADVFKLDYFGKPAFLAQSPQLYKQMCMNGDLQRVFEIGPVFRSENSRTPRHLCEFVGLDFEMEIKEHYHEVLETLGSVFKFIFDKLHANHAAELNMIRQQYPFEPLEYPDEPLVIHFKDAIQMLNDAGDPTADQFTDLNTIQEKMLGRLVKKQYNTDFFIVDRYPMTARPFYTMPCHDDSKFSNSYDVFLRGQEITSGAQRIHDHSLLVERALANEPPIPLSTIQPYIDSFKFGSTPHGGAGIGLERVVMLFCGLQNVRLSSLFPRDPARCTP